MDIKVAAEAETGSTPGEGSDHRRTSQKSEYLGAETGSTPGEGSDVRCSICYLQVFVAETGSTPGEGSDRIIGMDKSTQTGSRNRIDPR